VSSETDALGGNGGKLVCGKVVARGVMSSQGSFRLLRDDDHCEADDGMRSCMKCGMVDMRGERAHGLVGDIRSCSKVGSTNLCPR
jgi:hypothetical protein